MPCTTVLVGKKASHDGSTMIARTEDGVFNVKRMTVTNPGRGTGKKYRSVLGHLVIPLPETRLGCTICPSVDLSEGLWAAHGINEADVGMTATETITSNPRVLAADPLVQYRPASGQPGGIGEEDMLILVLPCVRSAREGVLRLAALLEEYGTGESSGIAFNDENEVWWMETVGGHHWIARRLPEDRVAVVPNQFGLDAFDLEDAFGKREAHLCSADLREFIAENALDLNRGGAFNPRAVFGSRRDMDHAYNTPRAWMAGRYLAPDSFRWDGPGADFTPESDYIPWSFRPDRKVTVEDVAALLSGHYQGTPFDPYLNRDTGQRGMYRSIGINRTNVTCICQIRSGRVQKGLQWLSYGSTVFGAFLPLYPRVRRLPDYVSGTRPEPSTAHFYWNARLIGALADRNFNACVREIDRYRETTAAEGRRLIREYDGKESRDPGLLEEANRKLCAMMKRETGRLLRFVLKEAAAGMRNGEAAFPAKGKE